MALAICLSHAIPPMPTNGLCRTNLMDLHQIKSEWNITPSTSNTHPYHLHNPHHTSTSTSNSTEMLDVRCVSSPSPSSSPMPELAFPSSPVHTVAC